jgi:precorrin-8X/cobalt-precorrin-8 methylmutase
MKRPLSSTGILVVGHGSPRAEANQGFMSLVDRVARRLGSSRVLPAFFSIAQPDIPRQTAELAKSGVRHVLLMPYFLYSGQHVTVDIPALLEECGKQFPDVSFEMLPTLENEPLLEDLVVDRLTPLASADELPSDGAGIEQRSYDWIDRQIVDWEGVGHSARQIARRVVHATADVSFARSLRVHPEAARRAQAAFAANRPVFCDVKMLCAGLTKVPVEVVCAIDDEDVLARASNESITRAAAAMEKFAPRWEGAIVAIGNAPTAVWRLLELTRQGVPRPALVVGLPVGFVGAQESKLALLESDLCYITNVGPRGGSPVAAAAVNALATLESGV